MYPLLQQIVKFQLAVSLFTSITAGIAIFTNPAANDTLTLMIGEPFLVEWGNAGSDYSELSLGLLADATGNDLWLLSNQVGYTAQNYQWSAATFGDSGILSTQGPFRFILVNGTHFGLEAFSTTFSVVDTSSSSSSSSSSSTTSSSSSFSTASVTSASTTVSSLPSSSSELSTGAKVGIGIGVAAAAILAGLALFFFIRRHRSTIQEQSEVAPQQLTHDKPELSGIPRTGAELNGEPEHNVVHEVSDENYGRFHEAP